MVCPVQRQRLARGVALVGKHIDIDLTEDTDYRQTRQKKPPEW